MCSSMFVINLLCCISNILGCWHLMESATYFVDAHGERNPISKDVSNVPPIISFLYNGKGAIEYADGKIILFDWKHDSNNTISLACNDRIGNNTFYTQVTDDSIILSEINSNNYINTYLLKQSKMEIEEYDRTGIKLSNSEYYFLKDKIQHFGLTCFFAEGREKNNKTLLIGGQEYLEIINGLPNTQYVVFVKSSNFQYNIPCYLVTINQNTNSRVIYANYIRHINIEDLKNNLK